MSQRVGRWVKAQWPVLAILLLAAGLRLGLWFQPLHQPANDEVEYLAVARDLLAGRGWVFYDAYPWLRAPLYPLFLAASLWLADGDVWRAALPNIVLSVANVWLVMRLTTQLVDRRVGYVAGVLAALLLTYATFASLYMAETLWAWWFLLGLNLLVAWHTTPRRWWLLAVAGVAFGLAALTRSALLVYLPLVALWFVAVVVHRRSTGPGWWFQPVKLVLLFAACVSLTIMPWTVRNYLAYGRPILIETGLAYNNWLFNEPRETRGQINRILSAIPNPAERADYANQQGLERLREDPMIVVRKLETNWVYLVRVKPIQDRFLVEDYRSDVAWPVFTAALVFDDLWYVIIGAAAFAGLLLPWKLGASALPPAWRWFTPLLSPRFLLFGWVVVFTVTALLTHGEARYRHFLFPALLPCAAVGLSRAWSIIPTQRRWWQVAVVLVIAGYWLWTLLINYPWKWAEERVVAGWYQIWGDQALRNGDPGQALQWYQQALDVLETPDGYLRRGSAQLALGNLAQAERDYRDAVRREVSYPAARARLGDLYRATGQFDLAREQFDGTFDLPLLRWSWRELNPAPQATLDVGGGLDYGYVDGVYPTEQLKGTTARWTNGAAQFRLVSANPSAQQRYRLRLAAPWSATAVVPLQVCLARACQTIEVGPIWRDYWVVLPTSAQSAMPLQLNSPTFLAPDQRRLGVLVDWIEVEGVR